MIHTFAALGLTGLLLAAIHTADDKGTTKGDKGDKAVVDDGLADHERGVP